MGSVASGLGVMGLRHNMWIEGLMQQCCGNLNLVIYLYVILLTCCLHMIKQIQIRKIWDGMKMEIKKREW